MSISHFIHVLKWNTTISSLGRQRKLQKTIHIKTILIQLRYTIYTSSMNNPVQESPASVHMLSHLVHLKMGYQHRVDRDMVAVSYKSKHIPHHFYFHSLSRSKTSSKIFSIIKSHILTSSSSCISLTIGITTTILRIANNIKKVGTCGCKNKQLHSVCMGTSSTVHCFSFCFAYPAAFVSLSFASPCIGQSAC